MSEKVKLTREQAEAIEKYKEKQREEHEIQVRSNCVRLREWTRPLITLETDDFINALYIGYEVEETFKVGDCVVLDDGQIVEIIEEGAFTFIVGWIANGSMYKEHVSENKIKRHATKQEKWWAKHGRDVWELKDLDILINEKTGKMYEVNILADETIRLWKIGVDGDFASDYKSAKEISKYVEVLCFAEDRKDV